MDRRQITLLGMFDLSAAFDMVDHAILLKRILGCCKGPCWGQFCFFFRPADLVALVQGFGLSVHVFADDLPGLAGLGQWTV